MSDLTDAMAADLSLILNGSGIGGASDLAFAAAYKPKGAATAASIQVFIGDPVDGLGIGGFGQGDNRTTILTASLAAVRAAIATILGSNARDPLPGDQIIIASAGGQVESGTWTITAVQPDAGDGVNFALRSEQVYAAGHRKGGVG